MAEKKRVVLFIPPANIGYGYINTFFWQKGVLHLASYIKRVRGTEYDVEIIDGNNRSLNACLDAINRDIFGAGVYCLDHTRNNGEIIVNALVNSECPKIILGGPGIINSKESYYQKYGNRINKSEIFYSEAQGELDVLSYLSNESKPYNQNRCSWDMQIYDKDEEQLYFRAYSRDLRDYITKQLSDSNFPYPPITYSTLSHLGCSYRVNGKGCAFCGIPHNFYHSVPGALFWHDFENFRHFCVDEYGCSYSDVRSIKDWGDSMSAGVLKQLIEFRPDSCKDIQYNCYLSCRDINEGNLDLLQKLNCFSLYMGIDGITIHSLKTLNKGYTPDALFQRLELLSKYPFKVEIGLIVGSRNETKESLETIVDFAKNLINIFGEKVIVIQGNVLIPMPGSYLYTELNKQVQLIEGTPKPLDSISVEQRIEKWLKYNTQISLSDCIETQHKIEIVSPRKHSYIEGS